MRKELILNDGKGVKDLAINDIGRINVFIGRNNSGKTSILKSTLVEYIKKDFTKIFSEKYLQRLYKSLTNVSNISESYFIQFMKSFEDYLKDILLNYRYSDSQDAEAIYFIVTLDSFVKLSSSKISEEFMGTQQKFNEEVKRIFKEKNSILYYDSKRALDDEMQISDSTNYSDSIKPKSVDGKKFLPYMHYSRNRIKSSKERKIFAKINDFFVEITSTAEFEIDYIENQNQTKRIVLYFKEMFQDGIFPSKDCGTGYKELILLLYATANPDITTIIIDEPENYLHPEFQRKLLNVFRNQTDKQYFIATHSSVLLDERYVDRIFQVKNEGMIEVSEITSKAKVLSELGYSPIDNLTSDLIIMCEGPSDRKVILEFLSKLGLVDKYSIKFLLLGGDIMSQVDIGVAIENRKTIALIDNDPGSIKERNRFMKMCRTQKVDCIQLERYSIENYYTVDALKKVFGNQQKKIPAQIKPDIKLEVQIKLNTKKKAWNIAHEMSLDDIEETDFYTEFLLRVKQLLEENPS